MNDDAYKEDRKMFHESWFNENTVDFWRHKRMYETIKPLALFFKDKKWLSVGDGRYGLDSYRLNKMFGLDIFPTDISENMLKESKKRGVIKDYSVENAERLSFQNNSFDIVFCKESFHHFPRPIMAVYEMIRVACIAVILIEPKERYTMCPAGVFFRQLIKMFINSLLANMDLFNRGYTFFNEHPHVFEQSGNYVYALSTREFGKIVHGLNLEGFAWKGLNDCYIKGCEFELAEENNSVFKTIKDRIRKADVKCNRFPIFHDWGLITAVIFKKEIAQDLKKAMEFEGYYFPNTVKNPHI